jgi:hypothetical protein
MTLDVITTELFDRDGVTSLGPVPDAVVTWQDEISKQGTANVRLPVSQAADLADRTILKFTWSGAVRFGCRVTNESTQLATDNLSSLWLELSSQPGLLSLLADAVVLPEYGIGRAAGSERRFGFMSKQAGWYNAADWAPAVGYAFSADTLRTGYPPQLAASNPSWIGAVSPATPQPVPTSWYFRKAFNVATAQNVSIVFTADNFLTLYLDGQEIASPDMDNNYSYRDVVTVPVRLDAGPHILAAQVTNANGGATNAMGLIGTVFTLSSNGTPNGSLLETDTSWSVNNGAPAVPGWRRAQVLKALVTEAVARGVAGAAALSLGFTDTVDSAGAAWTDTPDEFSFPIYTANLADIAGQLAESGIDITVDAGTMTLHAWNRKGADVSAAVALNLGKDDGSLTSYETASTSARFTAVGAQLADGRWTEVLDAPGVTEYGRIETGLAVGSSEQSATNLARAQLVESAQPVLTITAETSSLVGPQPFDDYDLGDTIAVPGHRDTAPVKARVIAISVDGSAFPVRCWPELVRDDSDNNGGIPPRRLPPSGPQRVLTKLQQVVDKVTKSGVGTGSKDSGGSGTGGGSGGGTGEPGEPGEPGPAGLVVVSHGTDPDVARPDSPVVYWIGTATPANGLAYDFWYDGPMP